jgi:hypothetical protein
MDKALRDHLAALGKEVGAAAIPGDCKHSVVWCIGQLPALYAKFRQTSESRYGEQITRLGRAVQKALAESRPVGPGAQQLAVSITDRLRLLHEQVGLPGLGLKLPGALPPGKGKGG